jgi:hypothetical protein
MSFLSAFLRDGPMIGKEVQAEARKHGISTYALGKASEALRVNKTKDGQKGPWSWGLPPQIGKAQGELSADGEAPI